MGHEPADCICGHNEQTHFRETGSCLHETPMIAWACACPLYQPWEKVIEVFTTKARLGALGFEDPTEAAVGAAATAVADLSLLLEFQLTLDDFQEA